MPKQETNIILRTGQKIIDFFLFSNLLIALGAALLCSLTYLTLLGEWRVDIVVGLVFLSTFCAYSLHRFVALHLLKTEASPNHVIQWTQNYYLWLRALFCLFLPGTLILFFQLNTSAQILLGGLAFITVFYSLPLFKTKGKWFRLRDIGVLKIFLISAVWAASTVWLPSLSNNLVVPNIFSIPSLMLERFLFIFFITLPFDIRDMHYDRSNGLKTIPVRMGEVATKRLGTLLFMLLLILSLNNTDLHAPLSRYYLSAHIFTYFIALILLYRTNSSKGERFYLGWVDGTTIFLPLLIFILFKACS